MAIVALLASTYNVYGQVEKKKYLREGNSQYKKARYPIADSLYAMAVMNDTSYATGYYNRGNALYLGGDAASAHTQWMKALMNTPGEEEKADILYNLGGLQMDAQNYGEAIKLYKDALRRNPSDEEARYNLALAKELLKDQQQNQNQDNQNQNQNGDGEGQNDQNKDQNQNNQDQNKDQNQNNQDQNKDQNQNNQDQNKDQNQNNQDQNKDQNQNNQDQNKDQNQNNQDQNKDQNQNNQDQNKNQNNGQGQNPPPQQRPLSSQDEQMLNAIAGKEKETQEKVKGEKVQGVGKKSTKDW